MSIVVRFQPKGLDRAKYDEILRRMEEVGLWPNPPGLEVHVAFGDEGYMRISDIWASKEQLEAFGEALAPIMTDVGVGFPDEPEMFEVHNLVK